MLRLLQAAIPVCAKILQISLGLVPQRLKHVFLPALTVCELLHCEVDALDTRCVVFFVEAVSVHIVLVFMYRITGRYERSRSNQSV